MKAPQSRLGFVLALMLAIQAVPALANPRYHVSPKISGPDQPPVVLPQSDAPKKNEAEAQPAETPAAGPARKPGNTFVQSPVKPASPATVQTSSPPPSASSAVQPQPQRIPIQITAPSHPTVTTPMPPLVVDPLPAGERQPFLRVVDGEINPRLTAPSAALDDLNHRFPAQEKALAVTPHGIPAVPRSVLAPVALINPAFPGVASMALSDVEATVTPAHAAPVTIVRQIVPATPAPQPAAQKASPKSTPYADPAPLLVNGKPVVKLPVLPKPQPVATQSVEPSVALPVDPVESSIVLSDPPEGRSPVAPGVVGDADTTEIPLLGGDTVQVPNSMETYEALLARMRSLTEDASIQVLASARKPVVQAMPEYNETAGQMPVKRFGEKSANNTPSPQKIATVSEPVTEKHLPTAQELQALEHFRLGNEYGRAGDSKKAIKEYEAALSMNPALKDTYVGLAAAYAARKKWKDAKKASYLALDGTGQFKFHNSPIQAHYNLSVAECALGNRQDSLAEYQVVKNARHPNSDNLREFIDKTCKP